MLPTHTVAGIDHWHRREFSSSARAAFLVMPNYDHIAVTANDANGVLNLLAFNFGGEHPRLLGGEHTAAQPVHRSFEAEAGASRRRVEESGHNAVLIIQRTTAGHHALHASRPVKQFHQQRDGELLRLDYMAKFSDPGSFCILGILRS